MPNFVVLGSISRHGHLCDETLAILLGNSLWNKMDNQTVHLRES